MAFGEPFFPFLSILLLIPLSLLPLPSSCITVTAVVNSATGFSNITAIYQLGDSFSDTGNLIRESKIGASSACAHFPYGQSIFNHPTGRCSNGLLMIDFIAKGIGVPLLNPYLNKDAIFSHGVNFAVAGATALEAESLAAKNITNPLTNTSLSVQLDWMWTHFNSICYDDNDCVEKLTNSLFMVGEIGSNDYYYALSQGKTMEDVKSMVFDVVQTILDGAKRVIGMGASKVMIPGIFPLGCFPGYVSALLPAAKPKYTPSYDEHRCFNSLNNLTISHNDQLRRGVQQLSQDYRNITIVYGDYYNAFRRLLRNAPRFGFNGTIEVQRACCGIGRGYNFNPRIMCGHRGVPVCANPDAYIIWDGLNLTQKAYRLLARWLIRSTISHI